jgi:hypothetical protein
VLVVDIEADWFRNALTVRGIERCIPSKTTLIEATVIFWC